MVVIVMGAAGAGKTTIGRALAAELGWRFVDGDDLQPSGNIEKMRHGRPLTDDDRAPWLDRLHALIARAIDRRDHVVVACSALKERYRQTLGRGLRSVRFVHLSADASLLRHRLSTRLNHFAGPELLASQLADLEVPGDAIIVDASAEPADILDRIRHELGV
jgi:gluconokinase